jgi:hypothetical protein
VRRKTRKKQNRSRRPRTKATPMPTDLVEDPEMDPAFARTVE